jgi:signal transduction histidine kinase
MSTKPKLPTSLARRFTLGAAGLAATALLLTWLASWWLLTRQHEEAMRELAARERQFHAHTVSLNLAALAERMSEVAGSTILATGLVDSAGRETYLRPFLEGIRQVNGMAVEVLFSDFEGGEIASNNGQFDAAQRQWLRQQLPRGRPASAIFNSPGGSELLALEPLIYPRTSSPDGGLLYKIKLNALQVDEHMQLFWGPTAPDEKGLSSPVTAPPAFAALGFRVQTKSALDPASALSPPSLAIFFLVLGLFCMVVLTGAYLARVLTNDLRQLQTFASHLVRDGLSQERALSTGTKEIASLSTSINQMLDRLCEQRQALTREGEKLATLAQSLELAERRRDEFVGMLARALRQPLVPMLRDAQLIQSNAHDAPFVARTGTDLDQQARRMAWTLDSLLDITSVRHGQIALRLETIDFQAVVVEAVQQIRPLIDAQLHHFTVNFEPGPMVVCGDHARLVQVAGNLLDNAAKYTAPGGYLDLSVAVKGAELCMRVGDNGNGIEPELIPQIFDLFMLDKHGDGRQPAGVGLGLALVKSLVLLHGGRVTADSPGLGKGSLFCVYLPTSTLPS